MPLLDHFHPPMSERRDWHSFHNAWAAQLAGDLNEQLPDDYFAEPNVQYRIEIDVAAFPFAEQRPDDLSPTGWPAPPATASVPFSTAPDRAQVEVYRQFGGRQLAGVIELVSPANKDRPETREAFVAKCLHYLSGGIGVAIVDVVTNYHANLHDELMARVGGGRSAHEAELYATAYRPTGTTDVGRLDIWEQTLAVGAELPSVPLWLPFGLCLEVRLDETYRRTLKMLKIRPPAEPVPG